MSLELNLNSQRSLMEYMNLATPVEPLLLNKVFNTRKEHNVSNYVDYYTIDRLNRSAKFSANESEEPYQVKKANARRRISFEIPRTWESKLFTLAELRNINDIGNLYGSSEVKARAEQDFIASELEDLQDRVIALYEVCAAQAITTGKIDTSVTDVNSQFEFYFDFSFTEKNTLTVANKWNMANSNPVADINKAKSIVRRATNINPDIVIMGSKAAEYFVNHKSVYDALDKNNLRVGAIDLTAQGTSSGNLISANFLGCQIYEYDQTFVNNQGKEIEIFPANAVVVIASKSKGNILHRGVIERNDPVKHITKRFIDDYYVAYHNNIYNTNTELECESRRIPMIHQPEAFVNLANIA